MNAHTVLHWFTTAQAADHAGVHRDTVIKACEAGKLHGSQRKPGGHWRIRPACLDAWIQGQPCDHVTAVAS